MTTNNTTVALRGAWITSITHDWRLRLHRRWAQVFGARPIVITLNPDGPGWRLHPEPPDWFDYLHQGDPLPPWDVTQIRSRGRLCIPCGIVRKAGGIQSGTLIYIMGQGNYLEIWSERAWKKLTREAFKAELSFTWALEKLSDIQ